MEGFPMSHPEKDFYKTAFVVPDLKAAARRMSALFDYEWLEVPAAPYEVRIGEEIHVLTLPAIITRQTPRIHLLQEQPGTPWSVGESGAAHHVAYWVDDIVEATARVLKAGFTIECCDAVDPSGPTQWAYFRAPDGLRVELLDRQGIEDPPAVAFANFQPFVWNGETG